MSKYRKLGLAALTAVVLAGSAIDARAVETVAGSETPSTPAAASGATAIASELRSVSVDRDGDGRPVVTLTGSSPMAYTTLELANPQRLVIDLKSTVSRLDQNQVAVDQGGVLRVRAGQFRRTPEPVSRVVVDLDRPVPYQIDADGDALKIAFGTAMDAAPTEVASATKVALPDAGPQEATAPEPPVSEPAAAPTTVAETKVADAKP